MDSSVHHQQHEATNTSSIHANAKNHINRLFMCVYVCVCVCVCVSVSYHHQQQV